MSPMVQDMQDMLFSATRRKRLLEESKSILFLAESGARRGWSGTPLSQRSQMAANHLPEQTQELTQGELRGNQELCLVQQGEGLLTDVTFNYYLETKTHNHVGY